MQKTHSQHFMQSAVYALVASAVIVSMLFSVYFFAEPTITRAQADTATFNIRQQITDETSFLVPPSNVTTSGSINGVTGGNASGTTDFVVQSNNATGYYVEIAFEDNPGAHAMIGDVTADEGIRDFTASSSEPAYGLTPTTSASFAYTITSDNPGDTDQSFLNFGNLCNQGGGSQNGADSDSTCWMEPRVAAFRIVDRSTAASNGATSTLVFDITVPSGATPTPSAETFTATATLSLFTQ